jgi:putative transposase
MPDWYRYYKGSVTSIRYHVIWIPRRRRKALVGDVAKRLIALMLEKAAEIDITIMRLAVEPCPFGEQAWCRKRSA